MKKNITCLLLALLLVLSAAGCGVKDTPDTQENGQTTSEEKTLTGSLDEVKDSMFVVTDGKGDSYALTFEQGKKPAGLEDQEIGSQVKVTYTGELPVVDPFEGEVLSVEAAE